MSEFKRGIGSTSTWEEPLSLCVGLRPRGFKRTAGTSRMNREIHVRICGGLEVRFLRSTRRRSDVKGEIQVEDPQG